MAAPQGVPDRTGIAGAVHRLTVLWALGGGAVLTGVVAVNVATVLGGIFGMPFPGDFELTEIGTAIAAFMFLPWCQMTGANVTADIFTARASPRWIAGFALLAAAVALGFSLLLLVQMQAGMADQRRYGYVTAILQVRIWWGFVPILASLALLAASALVTLIEAGRDLAAGGGPRDGAQDRPRDGTRG